MSIRVYFKSSLETIAILAEDEWELPEQLSILTAWVAAHRSTLTQGPYVADIGFSMRVSSGGGGVLSHETMKTLSEIDMSIYFSEYHPVFKE
jgi:hypothetical protein